jgi:hypothetical protein
MSSAERRISEISCQPPTARRRPETRSPGFISRTPRIGDESPPK